MKNICSIHYCNLASYVDDEKCILHCEKHEYEVDIKRIGFLNSFYDTLLNLILQSIKKDKFKIESLVKYFRNEIDEKHALPFEEYLSNQTFIFKDIYFPQSKSSDSFEYRKLLNKLGNIHFDNCKFATEYINFLHPKCFFENCKFDNGLVIYNLKLLRNADNILFQECEFNNEVSSFGENEKYTIDEALFKNCTFTKLILKNTILKKTIFNNTKDFSESIISIEISSCTIKDRFLLNNHSVEYVDILDSVFEDKFELKKARNIESISINNCQFKGLVDCYNSNFDEAYIYKSIFSEFVGFEHCRFGINDERCDNCSIAFHYVTFLNFVNMRNTNFISGLDMSNTNLKEYPNFLGSHIHRLNTNKETFRIIKYSFDKVGNTSEANKYFSYEMAKEMHETVFFKSPAKKIMLLFSLVISNFGQWYLLPLFWIMIVLPFHEYIMTNCTFDNLNTLNKIVKNILPIKRFLNEGMEFISLLFYITYSVLIYHFIISVKRVTKR